MTNSSASQAKGLLTVGHPGALMRGGWLRRGSGWPFGRPVAEYGLGGMVLKLRVGEATGCSTSI